MGTIKKTISMENIISRIPGLFPYILEDSYGIIQLHKAIDGDNGCYNKVIPDLKVNFDMINIDNNEEIFKNGTFYSYRTLMNHYYRLVNLKRILTSEEENLILFIEEGMGKYTVPSTIEGKIVPAFMFLTEMKEWWEWFQIMKPRCDCSKKPSNINNNDCCECAEYCDRGGDDMYLFLQTNVNKINEISDKYYNFALDGDKFNGYIKLDFMLSSHIDDMGISSIYSSEWIPGKKYHVGEIVLYNEESWILYQGSGGTSFILCNMNDNNRFDEGFDYYGFYNGKTDEIEFDSVENAHWRRNVVNKMNDMSYLSDSCKSKLYKSNIDLLPINSYYIKDNDSYQKLIFPTIDNVEINGVTNSKLMSLRRVKRSFNDDAIQESIPNANSNVDWCCLYESGITLNIQTWVDDYGNIVYYDQWDNMTTHNVISPSDNVDLIKYSNNLIAFGDILESITMAGNNMIKFEYCIGAHLIGTGVTKIILDDDTTEYQFTNFIVDEKHKGIQYTETYYTPKDFSSLYDVSKPPYENFVIDDNGNKIQKKGVFYTTGSKLLIKSELGNNGTILNNVLTDFITKRTEPDYIYSKEYRIDDLIGVTFDPIMDVNVKVDRGVNAAFEKHIKLGEVKTLDDLVNYGNNFFNVKNINE